MADCEHTWVEGPFFMVVMVPTGFWKTPTDHPNHGLLRIEHCTQCGVIRIPNGDDIDLRAQTGLKLTKP